LHQFLRWKYLLIFGCSFQLFGDEQEPG
jgi:hypothetical protein